MDLQWFEEVGKRLHPTGRDAILEQDGERHWLHVRSGVRPEPDTEQPVAFVDVLLRAEAADAQTDEWDLPALFAPVRCDFLGPAAAGAAAGAAENNSNGGDSL